MFWTAFVIDVLTALLIWYFFLEGLGDGSVSSFNIVLWLPMAMIPIAVLWGGMRLKAVGKLGAAKLLLWLLAAPAALLGGWMLLLIGLYSANPGSHH